MNRFIFSNYYDMKVACIAYSSYFQHSNSFINNKEAPFLFKDE